MKIITGGASYTVLSAGIGEDTIRYTLAETPEHIGETIRLETDTGMALRTDRAADWLRRYIEDGVLVLTNLPEPEEPEVTEPAAPTLEELRADKLSEINAACDAAITGGCGVTLGDGTAGHISLTIPDQINLAGARDAIQAGGSGYAYHLDGALSEVYTAADITLLAAAAEAHVLYHQVYTNHLRAWAGRATAAELAGIVYGAGLPEDLAAHMAAVIGETEEKK